MKKIVKIALALPLALNKMVKKTNWYNNVTPDKSNYPDNDWYRKHIERNYDVANLGSSSGVYDFDYEGLDVKAFNWAMQPQSLEYSFNILKMYFSILRQKGIILIPFCPFSGLSVTGKWAESAYDKYYGILDHTLIDNYERMKYRRQYPLLAQPKTALKRLLKDVPKKIQGRQSYNVNTDEEYEKDAQQWIANWKREFKITDLNVPLSTENRKGAEQRKALLNEMIEFCIERDLRPVLVLAPMHPSLSRKFTPDFREHYIYSFLRDANTHDVPFLNYIDDDRFVDNKYFDNSFFLSKEGAQKFTRIVLKDVGILK